MASTATATMLAATINYRGPEVYTQVMDAHPVLAWLREKKSVSVWEGGGEYIESIIETGGNTTMKARDYKEAIDQKEVNPLQTVQLPRMFVNGSITWYNAQEEANVGKSKVIDFVNSLIDNGASSMAEVLATQVWEDGSTNAGSMTGLPAIMGFTNAEYLTATTAADGVYQGIDRSVGAAGNNYQNNWWHAKAGTAFYAYNPVTAATTTFGPYSTDETLVIQGGTDGGVRRLYDDCCANGGTDAPDFGITTLDLYNKLAALVNADNAGARYNERMAELGYPENLQWHGATIVWDRGAPAKAFTFLNSKYLKLRPYAGYDATVKRSPIVSLEPLGIMGKSTFLQWCGNLSCTKPARCGALTYKSV